MPTQKITSETQTDVINYLGTLGLYFSSGYIGIGTNAPKYKLHLYESSSEAPLTNIIESVSGRSSIFVRSGAEGTKFARFIFEQGGTILAPTHRLDLGMAEDNTGALHIGTSDLASKWFTVLETGNIGIGTSTPTYQLQLSTDSAAKPTSNTWTIASDGRIKKDIRDFKDGLNLVLKFRPRTYKYNGLGGDGYNDTQDHVGFVAQEVELIAPYMVETGKGTINGEEVDDFKSYQGHALPFILINAIKEQQAQIEKLQRRIDELEKDRSVGREKA